MDDLRKRQIGHRIRRLREDAGMSQEEFAKKLGKKQGSISQYELGLITPRIGVIEEIARMFNVSKSMILDGVPDADPQLEELARIYHGLSKIDRAVLLTVARSLYRGREDNQADVSEVV